MSAVEAHSLVKRYGAVRALDRVSFRLEPATLTFVTGPNGAGKSTLLRVLAALTRPTSGEIRLTGKDPFGKDGASLRSRVGWIGAAAGLYADLTVEENLLFHARLHGLDPGRIEPALEDFGLVPLRDRRVRTLSQGFRRRAGLARVFLPAPSLILLDEPWNGLDAAGSEQLLGVLQDHRSKGATILASRHGRTDGADRILYLADGRMCESSASPGEPS